MRCLPTLTFILFCAAVSARADVAPVTLSGLLATTPPGAVAPLSGLDPLVLPPLDATRTETGGLILYSGSPEYIPRPGILYRDVLPAKTDIRLYVYHALRGREPVRVSVVLEPVEGPATVWVKKGLVDGPTVDYYGLGRRTSFIFLGLPDPPRPRRLTVDGPVLLDEDLDRRVVYPARPEPLIHSLHDFRSDAPVRVTVVAVSACANTLDALPGLAVLERDTNHDRGTYTGLGRDYRMNTPYSTEGGPRRLRLADGKNDPFPPGGDAITGRTGPYRGAYGVIYRLHLRMAAPDGRHVALLINPRGGGIAGAVTLRWPGYGRTAQDAPSLNRPPVKEKEEAVVLARFNPARTPEVTVEWTPPGSASLPVEFLLVPYEAAVGSRH